MYRVKTYPIMKSDICLEVSTTIHAPVSKVWEALTKPEIIKQYFFDTNTYTDWQPGHPIIFKGEWQGKNYEDKGTVIDVEKNKLIRYNYWSSMSGIEDKPENYVTITYDVEGKDNDVTLTVTQENIPDEKMKEHSEENWKKVLQELKNLLEMHVKTQA
jgi:uncharacterized protein YndB with AHSA1/START domain